MTPDERRALIRQAPSLALPHGPEHPCHLCRRMLQASTANTGDEMAALRQAPYVVVFGEQMPLRGGAR